MLTTLILLMADIVAQWMHFCKDLAHFAIGTKTTRASNVVRQSSLVVRASGRLATHLLQCPERRVRCEAVADGLTKT